MCHYTGPHPSRLYIYIGCYSAISAVCPSVTRPLTLCDPQQMYPVRQEYTQSNHEILFISHVYWEYSRMLCIIDDHIWWITRHGSRILITWVSLDCLGGLFMLQSSGDMGLWWYNSVTDQGYLMLWTLMSISLSLHTIYFKNISALNFFFKRCINDVSNPRSWSLHSDMWKKKYINKCKPWSS